MSGSAIFAIKHGAMRIAAVVTADNPSQNGAIEGCTGSVGGLNIGVTVQGLKGIAFDGD